MRKLRAYALTASTLTAEPLLSAGGQAVSV
jgi:hypothetical protein